MSNLLSISNLSKRYATNQALSDVSLEIEKPAAIGLVGKNGAGKTTLLSILSGALRPTSGSVSILGDSPQSICATGKLSILPQDATFKKGISIRKQLMLFAQLQNMSKSAAARELDTLLSELGDDSFVDRAPEKLSYGQRKRLGIVQAFLGHPQLVILDEPTAGLDPVVANDVRQLIRKLSGESAFIISSHNLYEIEDICSSVIILDKGKLIASKPISELAQREGVINLSLDKAADEELINALKAHIGIINVTQDNLNPDKLSLNLEPENMDQVQIQIQGLILQKGYKILDLNRGQALIDGLMNLVGTD